MFTYYDNDTCEAVGNAHSSLPCVRQDEVDDHSPHIHFGSQASPTWPSGPFFCEGYPAVGFYVLEEKEPA